MVVVRFHCCILAKMKNSKEIFRNLLQQITIREEAEEIKSILYLVMDTVLRLSRADIISEKSILLNVEDQNRLQTIIQRINQHEPVQYILEEAYFFGRKFKVTPAVLIPRPETELLVEEAMNESNPLTPGTIVDIGTGSGCIAVTLAKELPGKRIVGIDVSKDALLVANENALELKASVEFLLINVLNDFPFQKVEMIVSNPPYVAVSEKSTIKRNVLEYEPHLALFVADHDPLLFYKVIAQKGYPALMPNGKLLVEINECYGNEVADIFRTAGYRNIRIIKDFQNKDRIISANK